MSATANVQVHRNWIAAEDNRDLSNLEEFLHPNSSYTPLAPNRSLASTHTGR
ncbi:MAG TPA: hypothetical protein VN959_14530 [Mycobacterium sp.]|nr:hypothetical protein [Mycobacterium sp.]